MNELNHTKVEDLYLKIREECGVNPKADWIVRVYERKDGVISFHPAYYDLNKQFISREKAFELLTRQLKSLEEKL